MRPSHPPDCQCDPIMIGHDAINLRFAYRLTGWPRRFRTPYGFTEHAVDLYGTRTRCGMTLTANDVETSRCQTVGCRRCLGERAATVVRHRTLNAPSTPRPEPRHVPLPGEDPEEWTHREAAFAVEWALTNGRRDPAAVARAVCILGAAPQIADTTARLFHDYLDPQYPDTAQGRREQSIQRAEQAARDDVHAFLCNPSLPRQSTCLDRPQDLLLTRAVLEFWFWHVRTRSTPDLAVKAVAFLGMCELDTTAATAVAGLIAHPDVPRACGLHDALPPYIAAMGDTDAGEPFFLMLTAMLAAVLAVHPDADASTAWLPRFDAAAWSGIDTRGA